MPTGYTYKIGEGASFKEFVMACARAFGACVEMRDEPLDKEIPEFKVSNYSTDRIQETKRKIKWLLSLSDEDVEKEIEKEYNDEVERYQKSIRETTELKNKYNDMLKKVVSWNPPTEDHVELKKFMVSQIEESITFDCSLSHLSIPEKLEKEDWISTRIEMWSKDIKYYTKNHEEEIERVNGRNNWIKQLRESLKGEQS